MCSHAAEFYFEWRREYKICHSVYFPAGVGFIEVAGLMHSLRERRYRHLAGAAVVSVNPA
jgi:hypothetical protein